MREYLLVFLVALTVTYLLTVVAREIALRTGAVAKVRDRDVHAAPIPYLGGLAMLGGLTAAYFVARELPFLGLRSEGFVFKDAGVVLLAGALVCAVGVLDDIFELDALTKLGGQVLAAGLLVSMGVRFYYFPGPDGTQFSLDDAQSALLTLLVVIGTMNAVNFVDGLDGLAAGVVGIGAAAFFLYCYAVSDQNNLTLVTTGALLSAALAGACAGFLPHNFHPARLFMGDSGSMLIGLVLSASALTLTGQFFGMPPTGGNSLFVTVLPVLLPISLLMVPMVDLVLAVVRRTRAGRSPMSADKQHLHHRLLEIGHSQRRAVLIMWMWAATIAAGAVLVSLYDDPLVWWGLGTMLAVTVAMTFVLPRLNRPPKTGLGDTGLPENAAVEGRLDHDAEHAGEHDAEHDGAADLTPAPGRGVVEPAEGTGRSTP
ncbi:MraY family glycosyltransferase [Alloalcanivorax gelatiniphagus]